MAVVSAVLATTHHPFFYRETVLTPQEKRRPEAEAWRHKVEAYRATLTAARPDVLVMVGADHFHQLFYDNYPTFLIGKQPKYDATFHNEERYFGLPKFVLDGDEDLSGFLLQELIDRGFDFSVSHELKLDHSITCALLSVRPEADLPVVPIYTNIFAPPLAGPARFYALGQAIRASLEKYPGDRRIAVVGTGHLSLEIGGPRQFQDAAPDVEFDRRAVRWLADGDIDAILRNVTPEVLKAAGNATDGFLDLVLMLGVAGRGKADYADHLELFQTTEAFFTWYPQDTT
ncbi:DODA-type extradiol aromatic ring-opening family dioxygenase [Streptomyces paradoxus]|uniref:DODA-type extradiol aromatic ring-opening family dioxygenase n=1 Tax=Streptomyces paradoxus TaxID=66375 RepID=UPI0037D835D0